MKKIFPIVFVLLFQQFSGAQIHLPSYSDSLFPSYYWQRVTLFNSLPKSKEDIIFLGNSITDGGEWSELFNDSNIKNRGISGDITAGVINRLDDVVTGRPSKIFLLIGTNDLARNISTDSVVKNIFLIADYVQHQSPSTKLYVQSILPVNDVYGKFPTHTPNGKKINDVNSLLAQNATTHHYTYINLHSVFADANGRFKSSLTNDGLHLKGEAYLIWKHIVYPYVYDLQLLPSLIPLPQQLQFTKEFFPLYSCKKIFISTDSLSSDAEQLQKTLLESGINTEVSLTERSTDIPHIELQIGKINAPENRDEAYELKVSSSKIVIAANTRHGIFNAIQTLMQLNRDNVIIDGCNIKDYPAYSWRGYMVDVGRNFQSIDLLKQQIDVMSRYKLNIFHFHFTEDIAWRLQSKLYPQLTAPENMLRNNGMFYTENEFKELIRYCKERYITLVPEIDMPGHSAAFKRAIGVDMQSDSGVAIVKNILSEFCTTYNLPYMHIGGDEVHVSNKKFMPEVIDLVHNLGKTTIAWSPGASVDSSTIRQLWMSDNGEKNISFLRFIDSRHLYINHMDPLESVVTIFFRQFGDVMKEDKNVLGATLCLWPDRRVENEKDVLLMNPVYPSLLTFSERTWRGRGKPGWTAVIGEPSSVKAKDFSEFENRLLDNKKQYFKNLAFSYQRQSDIVWKLYGPFDNSGDLSKKFFPETNRFNDTIQQAAITVVGGTIILRHWWAPLIEGALKNPKENTTWYAVTKIGSDENAEKNFWIGFNNISRSPATDSPKPGTWDNHQSEIWVNGKLVESPKWKHAGQKGNSEMPLTDEGYEYRLPTKIFLQKGWNTVLIKAPVGSFKGKDWQNPEKWMFTCVPVDDVIGK
ncbi:MAG: family 20 glycosylhydrolase [Bacteroidetes bacterium]|nr:family 20 glycosylhydrolase [Bacteroidota bacterium]